MARSGKRTNYGADGNAERIVAELTRTGPQSRAQLRSSLAISDKTLKRGLVHLGKVNDGNGVSEIPATEAQLPDHVAEDLGGESKAVLTLGRNAGHVVGIEIGHSHLSVGIGDANARLLGDPETSETSHAIDESRPQDTFARVAKMVKEQLERADTSPNEVRGTAVSIPGPIGASGQTLSRGVLAPYDGVPIPERLSRALERIAKVPAGVPVFAENDVDVLARGEQRYGKAFGLRDFAVIKCSGGVGAAIVSNDGIVRGRQGGGAGEIGHCPIKPQLLSEAPAHPWNEDSEPKCRCGCWGHLEAYAGGNAVVARIGDLESGRRSLPAKGSLSEKLDAAIGLALREEGLHRSVIMDAAGLVGLAANTIIHLFNPQLVLISGKMSEMGEPFVETIRRECGAAGVLFGDLSESIQLGTGTTPAERRRIGIRGAVTTALRKTPSRLKFK